MATEWLLQSFPHPSAQADEGLCLSQTFLPFLCPEFPKRQTFSVALQMT